MIDSFYLSLPAKRMGAGVLLVTSDNRVVVVKPVYKKGWEVPGGIVEKDESPRAGALREVKEELGLDLLPEDVVLASLDYMATGGDKSEALMFLFAVRVSDDFVGRMSVDGEEVSEYALINPSEATAYLGEMLGSRVQRAVAAFLNGGVAYFEGRYSEEG